MPLEFNLPVKQPFDWYALLDFLRLRATAGVEAVSENHYWRTAGTVNRPATFSVYYDPERFQLRVCSKGGLNRALLEERVKKIFKIDIDTAKIEESLCRDRWLRGFVQKQPGLRVPGGWSDFEIAVRAVIGQQISVPAATTLMGRLVRIAGTRLDESAWLFPSPAAVVAARLDGLGMPGKRIETVQALAAFFAGHDDLWLADQEAEAHLLSLPGIGPWTAGYILMRTRADHDHWPVGDLILRKALSTSSVLVSPDELIRRFMYWCPYRSFATLHIWKGYAKNPGLQK